MAFAVARAAMISAPCSIVSGQELTPRSSLAREVGSKGYHTQKSKKAPIRCYERPNSHYTTARDTLDDRPARCALDCNNRVEILRALATPDTCLSRVEENS